MTQGSTRFAVVAALALFASACGPSSTNEEAIATSVALTVEAQDTQQTATAAAALPTETLPASPTSASTTKASSTPTSPPPAGGEQACMSASLIGETIPDGTIMTPGQQFTKIWKIQNTSTCIWNTSYKIVFWNGEVMGGGYVYNFPQQALPGDTVDVPLVLIAPTEEGDFQGQWKLQTPGGSSFGVGYDTPFWVDIVVSSDTDYDYGITSVSYAVERQPETGCPANVFYDIYATITVNGPVTITYNWTKSDGTLDNKKTIKFTEAGSKTVRMAPDSNHSWSIHLGSATNPRWAYIFTTAPENQEFSADRATFHYTCGQ